MFKEEDFYLFDTKNKNVLEHLGKYVEEPYEIIESYFQGQHLDRLVRHQIESYNHFINYQIQKTISIRNRLYNNDS